MTTISRLAVDWKLILLRGSLAIAFGIIAIAAPIETVAALAIFWGCWALVDGMGLLFQAFRPEGQDGRWWLVFMGFVAVLAGFFAIVQPGLAATTLTWILGIWLFVRGVFELGSAISGSTIAPRWLVVASALASLVLGVLFMLNPAAGAVSIALTLGIIAIAWGATMVATGYALMAAPSALKPEEHHAHYA
jgi:uncharacterized membrane protein HdeD (DUF308 family)